MVTEDSRKSWGEICDKKYMETVLASMADGLIVIDSRGTIRTVNQAATRLLGYPIENALIGQPIGNVFVEEEEEEEEEEVAAVLRGINLKSMASTGRASNLETIVLAKDGTRIPVLVSGAVLGWGSGNGTGAVITFKDITERKQAELALKEREAHLRSILDHALDAIVTLDKDGRITEFNPAATALFGYSQEEAIGQMAADLIIPPELRKFHSAALANQVNHARRTGRSPRINRRVEFQGLRADAERIDLEVGLTAISRNGELCFTAFMHDITDRKQLLKSLKDTLEVAESANRAKSEFLANMSHEIRSPMNAIIGMTDLVLNTQLSPEDQRENLQIVLRSAESLLALINGILDLSKLEAGQIVLERIPFDLRNQVENACETLAIRAHQKDLELYCDLAPDVPETLVGDPLRLQQILINLINNAIKFTDTGEVIVRVEGEAAATADPGSLVLHFSVADTGIGIPQEKSDLIFERFTQADGSTTRKYGGTGLGLAICRRLVGLMDGELQVDSTLGKGSVFHFTVRMDRSARSPGSWAHGTPGGMDPATAKDAAPLAGVQVLLADSHATGRRIVGGLLSGFGAAVRFADCKSTLLAALELPGRHNQVCNQACDVLMVDNILLRELLAGSGKPQSLLPGGNKPLLLLPAGFNLQEYADHDWLQGAISLKKPVRRFQLLKKINQALGRTRPEPLIRPGLPNKAQPDTVPLGVLLVDGLLSNQRLVSAILGQAGHTVTIANNGHEALDLLRAASFDMILMDLHLPELDGFEITRRIRKQASTHPVANPQVPIIAVGAQAPRGEEDKCLNAGMNGYLKKPIRTHELLQTVNRFTPARNPTAGNKALTRSPLIKNQGGIDPTVLSREINVFLDEAPGHVEALRTALEKKNSRQAIKEIGWLKNAAQGIGAQRVAVQSMRLRGQAEVEDWESSWKAFTRLEQIFAATVEVMTKEAKEP
ncbi:MAG: PAS domain S-box protein [Magnetococcales bacterium]|nr:PAS domain S-box protein [Magnetococcales bacterium]